MDTYSATAAAGRLGTNTPRVLRALRRLGLETGGRGANGRFCLTEEVLNRLHDELGITPRIKGFNATEVKVLGALALAPLGLSSIRALARQAGLSPTATSRATVALQGKGLIRRESTVIAAGRAREALIIDVNRHHADWRRIQGILRTAAPGTRRRDGGQGDVPPRLRHLFWNTAPSQLCLATSGPYIARRLLTRMDFEGLAWGAAHLSPSDWEQAAKGRGFDESVRALAHNLARGGKGLMGRATGDPTKGTSAIKRGSAFPSVLPEHTISAWRALRPVLPKELYLGGGTAVAVHLHHRESRDLDFFYHDGSVDLVALAETLRGLRIAITLESEGTLHALRGETKVEFFHVDTQRLLRPTSTLSGLRIASLEDLIAMKLKVVGDRGELRDYYDLKLIEEEGGISIEDGIAFFLERYDASPSSDSLQHVIRALGYLGDIEEDDRLPVTRDELADWWGARQARLIRHLARNPL